MSAGNFEVTSYEIDDGGGIGAIRVQPETTQLTNGTVANDAPTGAVTFPIFIRARKGVREYGLGARSITIRWDGAPPTDYSAGNLTVPILTEAAFTAYTLNSTVTYLGASATVVGRTAERRR